MQRAISVNGVDLRLQLPARKPAACSAMQARVQTSTPLLFLRKPESTFPMVFGPRRVRRADHFIGAMG